ncbi:uncharacterized protein KY384_008688 [Bacidia gigantensis]|uniref:uncharacterized protein n=1 Tax=Bacidia gigantensis TaxID=2732470 RepID=UPI001D059D43|nr:uncharacterized protein KY384_008688 [Bacidia gigantensis]KAG8526488.1 hypothetical protein KY384_008688 [Bacidia gigantensis]
MPAPLAKGLLLSFSFLFAAGLAVYDSNPQIRQWIDDNRRRVAVALHGLGDEVAPGTDDRNATDASTREHESPEAVERRRRARQDILERGRLMEERRRAADQAKPKMSFDDLVDKDGSLKREESSEAFTSAAETHMEETGLRHRATETNATMAGSSFANPFDDETMMEHLRSGTEQPQSVEDLSRTSTPTLPASPPVPPKPAAYQPRNLLIDTDQTSSHPSEQLINLTPTTSHFSAAIDLATLRQSEQNTSQDTFMSVHEWAQDQSTQSLHSPLESISNSSSHANDATEGSVTDSLDFVSQMGTEDGESASDLGEGISTPSTWTEVGSMVSEE